MSMPLPPLMAHGTFSGAGFHKFVAALTPEPPDVAFAEGPTRGVSVSVSLPWGILGTIRIDGAVPTGAATNAAKVGLTLAMSERSFRRAVSVAVESAIGRTSRRLQVVGRALSEPHLRNLAYSVLVKRGDRKQRKAMRRLLRAAGVTRDLRARAA